MRINIDKNPKKFDKFQMYYCLILQFLQSRNAHFHTNNGFSMVMLKSEISNPAWVPEGYRKLGWHAGFDVLIGPMYYKKNELG